MAVAEPTPDNTMWGRDFSKKGLMGSRDHPTNARQSHLVDFCVFSLCLALSWSSLPLSFAPVRSWLCKPPRDRVQRKHSEVGTSEAPAAASDLLPRVASLVSLLGDALLTGAVGEVAPSAPRWLKPQWADFVLGLADDEVVFAERHGLRRLLWSYLSADSPLTTRPPASLVQLVRELEELESFLVPHPTCVSDVCKHGAGARKAEQVAAFAGAIESGWFRNAPAGRVVDVGAGRGALTRELSLRLHRPCLGLDMDPDKVDAARVWAGRAGSNVSFAVCDVRNHSMLAAQLDRGDLVVGLHPCGSLGEDIIKAVADAAPCLSPSLLMVSCCLHGRAWAPIAETRQPSSLAGQQLGLSLPRSALRKTNLWGPGEAPLQKLKDRLGLRWLLEQRGHVEAAGLFRGLSRKDIRAGLRGGLARKALEFRQLPVAEESELEAAEHNGANAIPAYRRLELLTILVGDIVELAVNLDRACALEEAGLRSAVGRLFPRSTSPRNLAVYATAAS